MSYHAEEYEEFIKAEGEDPYVEEAPQILPIPTLRWWWCSGHGNKFICGYAFGNVRYKDGTMMGFQLPASTDHANLQQGSWVMVGDTGVYQLGVPSPRRPKQPKYTEEAWELVQDHVIDRIRWFISKGKALGGTDPSSPCHTLLQQAEETLTRSLEVKKYDALGGANSQSTYHQQYQQAYATFSRDYEMLQLKDRAYYAHLKVDKYLKFIRYSDGDPSGRFTLKLTSALTLLDKVQGEMDALEAGPPSESNAFPSVTLSLSPNDSTVSLSSKLNVTPDLSPCNSQTHSVPGPLESKATPSTLNDQRSKLAVIRKKFVQIMENPAMRTEEKAELIKQLQTKLVDDPEDGIHGKGITAPTDDASSSPISLFTSNNLPKDPAYEDAEDADGNYVLEWWKHGSNMSPDVKEKTEKPETIQVQVPDEDPKPGWTVVRSRRQLKTEKDADRRPSPALETTDRG